MEEVGKIPLSVGGTISWVGYTEGMKRREEAEHCSLSGLWVSCGQFCHVPLGLPPSMH